MSDSLRPHEPQHARPPCPSPTPGVYSDSCPLSQWCHPTISSSVVPFSSCLQSFPASGSFQTSQFFTSGGQIIGVSTSASVLPVNTQDWSPLGWTGWISLHFKRYSRVFSTVQPQFKGINSSVLSFLYSPTLTSIHDYWKNHSFDKMDLCWQSAFVLGISLLFLGKSWFLSVFLTRPYSPWSRDCDWSLIIAFPEPGRRTLVFVEWVNGFEEQGSNPNPGQLCSKSQFLHLSMRIFCHLFKILERKIIHLTRHLFWMVILSHLRLGHMSVTVEMILRQLNAFIVFLT